MSGGVPKRVLISQTQSNTPSKAGKWGKPGIILCNGARSRRAMCNSIQTRAKYCPKPCKPKSGPALTPTATMTVGELPDDNLIGFGGGIPGGALVPNNIVSPTAGNLTIESIRYVDATNPVFVLDIQYPVAAPLTATDDITSITLINCDNGAKITYNTNDLGINPNQSGNYDNTGQGGTMAQWDWVSNTQTELLQGQAFWQATVGKSIKIIIEFTGGPSLSKTVSDYCVNAPTYTPPTPPSLGGQISFSFGVVVGQVPVDAASSNSSGEMMAGMQTTGGGSYGTISPLPASLPGNRLRQIGGGMAGNNIRYTYDYTVATGPNFNLYITASNGLGPNPVAGPFQTTPFSSIKFTIDTGPNVGDSETYVYGDFTYVPNLGLPKITGRYNSEEGGTGGTFEQFWRNASLETVSIVVTA